MEIRRLELRAFGLFTNETLDFEHESGGLYLIFGPNEAGKSSALRALKALLYGVPERTADNFIHANDKLRIGGLLRRNGNRELALVRRKGRKNTAVSPSGDSLDEASLQEFLQGVTLEQFETVFGIDHGALVRGGREILEQKGEIGQLLFSAALGNPALHSVLETLDRETEALFKPRGSVQKINAAVREYNERMRQMREVSLSSGKWNEHRRALSRTTEELEQVRTEIAHRRKDLARLQRIKRILPKLAQRRELLRRRMELGEVVILADDFKERRQATVRELGSAQAVQRNASTRLHQLDEELELLEVRPQVLQEAEAIEALHEDLGGHRKIMKDHPRIAAERRQLLVDLETLLKQVNPTLSLEELETLRPVLNRRSRIAALGNRHQALLEAVQGAQQRQKTSRKRLDEATEARRGLSEKSVPDPVRLRRAIAAASRTGQIDERLASKEKECELLEKKGRARLARLALRSRDLQAVPTLPVPSQESIDRFESDFDKLAKNDERLHERREAATAGLHDSVRRLDEIRRAGIVPSEQDLVESRTQRDRAWELLRRQWLDSEDVWKEAETLDPDHSLPEAFELRISRSDELADRLRWEADRVHKQAHLLASQSEQQSQLEEIETRIEELGRSRTLLINDWKAIWEPSHIEPRSPREMRPWLADFEKLRDEVERWTLIRRETEEIAGERARHLETLRKELESVGQESPEKSDSLGSILTFAEEVAGGLERGKRHREELDNQIPSLRRELETAETDYETAVRELEEWTDRWKHEIRDLGLDSDALPSEANDVLEDLRELFSKHAEAEKLRIRMEGMERDTRQFETEVRRVAENASPELVSVPVEQEVARLHQLLKEDRSNESRLQEIENQREQAEADIRESRQTMVTMNARLAALCREAQCEDPDQLEEAEKRSDQCLRLRSENEGLEREILNAGEGASLEDLEQEVQGTDPDALTAEIDRLGDLIDRELEPKYTELAHRQGAEHKELSLMDGGDRAAVLADEAEGILAGIRSSAEHYVRLRLAGRILRQQIERYRRENEGPLLRRAGELFARLTCGSFCSLRVDFDEKDEPVLVGVRPPGSHCFETDADTDGSKREPAPTVLTSGGIVHVEGMSSGSRDQLYLALRLAALEQYMTQSEPLPFVVDDILVQFDDDRSAATLEVLAELGTKTQVILFTHHSRLVEQARKLKSKDPVKVLELHRSEV